MKYADFEKIISVKRMERYLIACGGDTRKAMTLYRYNLQISQEMFTIVSCFEVALRNAIDRKLTDNLGEDWLRDSIMPDGVFTEPILRKTRDIIAFAHRKLTQSHCAGFHEGKARSFKTGYTLYDPNEKKDTDVGNVNVQIKQDRSDDNNYRLHLSGKRVFQCFKERWRALKQTVKRGLGI